MLRAFCWLSVALSTRHKRNPLQNRSHRTVPPRAFLRSHSAFWFVHTHTHTHTSSTRTHMIFKYKHTQTHNCVWQPLKPLVLELYGMLSLASLRHPRLAWWRRSASLRATTCTRGRAISHPRTIFAAFRLLMCNLNNNNNNHYSNFIFNKKNRKSVNPLITPTYNRATPQKPPTIATANTTTT